MHQSVQIFLPKHYKTCHDQLSSLYCFTQYLYIDDTKENISTGKTGQLPIPSYNAYISYKYFNFELISLNIPIELSKTNILLLIITI